MGHSSELILNEIGQIALTVQDLDRAVPFYRDVLCMSFLFQMPNMAFFDDPDGNSFAIMSVIKSEVT